MTATRKYCRQAAKMSREFPSPFIQRFFHALLISRLNGAAGVVSLFFSRNIVRGIGFLSFAILLAGCARHSSDDAPGRPAPVPGVSVQISSLFKGSVDVTITAIGKTDAVRKERILSPNAGKIIALKVLEGDVVKPGQVLCVLRPKEAQAALDGAKALLHNAKTQRQKAEARRMLVLADFAQNTIEVHASFDGVVVSRGVTEGQFVAEQTEMFTLVDLATADFIANVPLDQMGTVRIGQRARIAFELLSNKSIPAIVDAIIPQVDIQTQTARVRLRFDYLTPAQRQLLRMDMMGTASIITATHQNVLLVPRSALLRNDETDAYSIVTITADSLSKSLPVTVGVMTDSAAEVHGDNLYEGMPVITTGNYALSDSSRVSVRRP